VAECIVYTILAFSPLAFGVVAAWSREIFLMLVALAAVDVTIKHVALAAAGHRSSYRWSWTYPLVLAFLALSVLQAVHLPAAWVRAMSPGTVALKAELLADLPNLSVLLQRPTLSFYTWATAEQTILVAAIGVLFVIVLDVFREAARIRRLLSVIAGVGMVVAAVAGYQNLTGSKMIYGVVKAIQPNSGPFFNYSHFSQFMNLSIAAALALILDRLSRLSKEHRGQRELWISLRQPRNAGFWAWVLLCVVGPILILLSMSRMGMLSLGIATVFTGAMLAWRGRTADSAAKPAQLLAVFGLVVFAGLLLVGFDAVSTRLDTLRDLEVAGSGRQEMLRDMVGEFRRFPLLGTGLGTHQFVFGMFDRRNRSRIATQAENEYAQLMEESGAVGVALAAVFLAVLVGNYFRATRRPTAPIDYVPFGLGFGLIAILAHSCTDFAQSRPAGAELTATYAALLSTLARRRPPQSSDPIRRTGSRRLLPTTLHLASAGAVIVATVAVWRWADPKRVSESHWTVAKARADVLEARHWVGTAAEFADVLAPAQAAVAADPEDVEHRYWTDVYRSLTIPRVANPKTGAPVLTPPGMQMARAIAADLNGVRALCPTYGQPVSALGQINRDLLGQPDLGARQIRLSYRLAPFNLDTCLIAGLNAVECHHWFEAAVIFEHYAKLKGGVAAYADACIRANQPLIPYWVVQDSRPQLLYLVSRMPLNDPGWADWIETCRSRAAELLAAEAARPDAPPATLAEQAAVDRQQGRLPEAINLYQRALASDYGNERWRVQLAQALAATGQFADAADQLRTCLQLRPDAHELEGQVIEYEKQARKQSRAP
jgi:hypothetical protein